MSETTNVMDVEVGREYDVRHERKGTFRMVVDDIHGEWVSGTISKGIADAVNDYNVKGTGEEITVRRRLCHFTPVA